MLLWNDIFSLADFAHHNSIFSIRSATSETSGRSNSEMQSGLNSPFYSETLRRQQEYILRESMSSPSGRHCPRWHVKRISWKAWYAPQKCMTTFVTAGSTAGR